MAQPSDLSKIANIANAIFNSISANNSSITSITSGVVTLSATPPATANNGAIWYDTETGIMYAYYENSSVWVDSSSFLNSVNEDYTAFDCMGAGDSFITLTIDGGKSVISNYRLAPNIDSGSSSSINAAILVGGSANSTFDIFDTDLIDAGIASV
jgi:hypothetical protein